MDNQHRLIKGYRELSAEEIAAMNKVKELGEQCRVAMEELKSIGTVEQEWVYQAEMNLKVGIMMAVRSIAKPESF